MVFKNDTDNDMEGELVFPLEEGRETVTFGIFRPVSGATVCGYAVDIAGVMVDAVVCEKEVARKAFETEVREKRAGKSAGYVQW
jgi:hypothetical protein